MKYMKITLAHGSGGSQTSRLINEVFADSYGNDILAQMEDSAVVASSANIALTTDSFVVKPMFFKGGDIGRLAVCGTVNDLLMRAAEPKYLTSAFIIEEGAETEDLKRIAQSMASTAEEAGVQIVAGDTKVIEGNGEIYINTAGVGFVKDASVSSSACKAGDKIILSGNLGDHHCTILSSRMNIENNIKSDCAPLSVMVRSLIDNNIAISAMRDVTRGGLATVLNELADASAASVHINECDIPVNKEVEAFAQILGLEVLNMGNEGKMVCIVSPQDCEKALSIIKASPYGENACVIGEIAEGSGVLLHTQIGGVRRVPVLTGEGLPRIC